VISFSEAQILAWVSPLIWPFLRALALFSVMPVLGTRMVPTRVRIGLAAMIAFAAQPALPPTPEVALDPSLTEPAMRVKGRNGFLIGQVIQYGEYRTEPVRRGWTQSYDVPFFVRFQGAKEKLSYTQIEPHGLRAAAASPPQPPLPPPHL
jgi:hypothetical protein